MEELFAQLIRPGVVAIATSYVLLLVFFNRICDLMGKCADRFCDHLEAAIESQNRPSHLPGLTVIDVMRRRSMQQRIHGRKT